MAGSATAVLENSRRGVFPLRFSSGTTFPCQTLTPGGTECRSDSRPAGSLTPHYLIMPVLDSVQEVIHSPVGTETPCRILAGLNRIFPIKEFIDSSADPLEMLSTAFRAWLESFMSKRVLARFDMALQFLSTNEVKDEFFDEFSSADTAIRFGFCQFDKGWFPIGEILKEYDQRHPGLAKYILRMLSDCPLFLATPEEIYEITSDFCWESNENEEDIFDERYAEYLEMGESEEDARDSAREAIMVDYAEFEEYLPEWTFKRSERDHNYHGPIPPELQNLRRCHAGWRRRKQVSYFFPNYAFPGIAVSLDHKSHDFICDVISRFENELLQGGMDYCFSTLSWPFAINDSRKLRTVLHELQFVLEYFSACADFLLTHEKEPPHA